MTSLADALRLNKRLSIPGLAVSGGGRLAWARDALHAWDFLTNQARWNSVSVGALSNTPNWTFTRASTGYAQNAAGVLIPFASGELRRTDKGVLIEGARTNLCLQSQTFDNASWVKGRASVTSDAMAAPDGTMTADKLLEDTAIGTHRAYQTFTKAASAITYSFSIYLKASERTFAHIRMAETGEGNPATVSINLSTGALGIPYGSGITGVSALVSALANGWYRVTITGTTTTDTYLTVYVMPAIGLMSGDISYGGDVTKGIYIWGAQLEQASFPSSYIPTTTASATRAADVLTVTGLTGVDYPLSLFAEVEPAADTGGFPQLLQIDSGSGVNRLVLRINWGSAGDNIGAVQTAASVEVASPAPTVATTVGATRKAAARGGLNSVRCAVNGTLSSEDTSAAQPSTPSTLRFGDDAGGSWPLFGYLRRAALWTRALTDAELQAVTT